MICRGIMYHACVVCSFHCHFQVATVLDQLHKFLGPELKAVTGESAGIDEIMDRVEGLALPLNKVIFDSSRTMSTCWEGLDGKSRQITIAVEIHLECRHPNTHCAGFL